MLFSPIPTQGRPHQHFIMNKVCVCVCMGMLNRPLPEQWRKCPHCCTQDSTTSWSWGHPSHTVPHLSLRKSRTGVGPQLGETVLFPCACFVASVLQCLLSEQHQNYHCCLTLPNWPCLSLSQRLPGISGLYNIILTSAPPETQMNTITYKKERSN